MNSLEVQGITKIYSGNPALRDVSLSVSAGEVVAVCGENGAGKSTLMNVLAGVRRPTLGRILIDGEPVDIDSPRAAFSRGIHTVFQELSLLPALSITENLLLGQLPHHGLMIDWAAAHARASQILASLGFPDIDVRQPVRKLSLAFQQIVEIAKALSHDPQMLVLDEPTGVLTDRETEALFAQVAVLQQKGRLILYISHRLEEVLQIADRIVVLKDGRLVDTMIRAEASIDRIVRGMVGREISEVYPQRSRKPGKPTLEAINVSGKGFDEVSLTVNSGEIVGLFGLIGSGRTEFARTVFGADRRRAGDFKLEGEGFVPRSPAHAIAAGIAMVTEERKHDGLVLGCDLVDNTSLASLGQTSILGVLDNVARRRRAREKVAGLSIRPAGLNNKVRTLSGGNQQKVVLAKWLLVPDLKLLILDEPTRGVDVGTKVEIYNLIADLAAKGTAILLISSELPEVLGLSDRIAVFRDGRLVVDLWREASSEELLFGYAAGVDMHLRGGAAS